MNPILNSVRNRLLSAGVVVVPAFESESVVPLPAAQEEEKEEEEDDLAGG